MSIWQDNARDFTTRPEPAISMERRAAVTLAVQLILDGRSSRARHELARSVQRQARMAGLGDWPIEPRCPCGGRCEPNPDRFWHTPTVSDPGPPASAAVT